MGIFPECSGLCTWIAASRNVRSPRPSDTLRVLETLGEADMEGEQVPDSWVGRRVRIITTVTADRTAQEEATLLDLDQIGITIRREELVGGGEEVVFHPWTHVYQLGPLVG
jgi:hypothetical protein